MNDQLARTLGIEFIRNGKSAYNGDLVIRKSKDKKMYIFSFSDKYTEKLGGYVRLAVAKNRLYIAPGCKDGYSFRIVSKSNGRRGYVNIMASTIGFIDKFLGQHKIEFYEDLDAYYIKEQDGERDA